jgi:hypothetical protein
MSVLVIGDPGRADSRVFLNVTRCNWYKREAVFSGTDYVGTRHTVSWRCVFNPGTQGDFLLGKDNSYLASPPHALPPAPTARQFNLGPLSSFKIAPHSNAAGAPFRLPAAFTAESVKHYLMQPRMRLQWAWDHQNVLISPLPGMVCDATGGPFPVSCDVAEMHSGKTWMVDYVWSSVINECPQFAEFPHAVLSNQYGQTEDLDADFLRTTTTRGTVVFDRGVLETSGVLGDGAFGADDLVRADLFLPVPSNMKREHVRVALEPDGVTLRYEVVDRELPLNWDAAGITRVEGIHKVTNELPNFSIPIPGTSTSVSIIDGAARTSDLFNLVGRFPMHRGMRAIFKHFGLDAAEIGGLTRVGWSPAALLSTDVAGACCSSYHLVQVKAWGHRGVLRNTMEQFIRDIITKRIMPIRDGGMAPITLKSEVTHSVEGNWVEAVEVYRGGPLRGFGDVLPTKTVTNAKVFGDNNDTKDLIITASTKQVQRPPYDNTSRATQLEGLVSSALSRPCGYGDANLPPQPPVSVEGHLFFDPAPPAWPRPAGV